MHCAWPHTLYLQKWMAFLLVFTMPSRTQLFCTFIKSAFIFSVSASLIATRSRKIYAGQADICPEDLKERNQPDKGCHIEHRLISDLSVDPESHVFLRFCVS